MLKMDKAQARGNFTALLDAIEQGEEITITRRGQPFAKLVRADAETMGSKSLAAAGCIRRLREGATLGGELALTDLIEQGRR